MDTIQERAERLGQLLIERGMSQLIVSENIQHILRELQSVRDAERERCAGIADNWDDKYDANDIGMRIAAAIREGDE